MQFEDLMLTQKHAIEQLVLATYVVLLATIGRCVWFLRDLLNVLTSLIATTDTLPKAVQLC